jgi:hypothetical protein
MMHLRTAARVAFAVGLWHVCHEAWAAADGSAAETLQEVTVTAHRAQLQARVSNFVDHIAAVANEEGLPRWQKPVCPLVSGLVRQDGEFILGRLSEIASAAGAPLAGENCHPNLYILVHPQPVQLLLAMEKRNRGYTFGDDTPPKSVIDKFIATPQAVRIWYTSEERTTEGVSLLRRPGDPPPHVRGEGSPFVSGVVWSLERVFVVVDQTRLKGITRGQLADYVGMVALADLKPGANVGDTRTILKLFDGAPQAAPAAMTDWDQAFLKSLYSTDQNSKVQRSQISHQMVHEMEH